MGIAVYELERIYFGVFFVAVGIVGAALNVKRRALRRAILSIAFLVPGLGILMRLCTIDTAFGGTVVLIAAWVLVDGIRTLSAKTILVALVCAAAGAGMLAGLIPHATVFWGYMAAFYGVLGLRAAGARNASSVLFFGGMMVLGIGFMCVRHAPWLSLSLVLAGLFAASVGLAREGWQIKSFRRA